LSPKPDWRKSALQPKADLHKATIPAKGGDSDNAVTKHRTIQQTTFTDMACPTAHVSAFCRAVISRVIPDGFWGSDDNKRTIMYWVDQFVDLRRFESLTLHQVTQNIQVYTPFVST
jgi:telomerase reverse transcriptase